MNKCLTKAVPMCKTRKKIAWAPLRRWRDSVSDKKKAGGPLPTKKGGGPRPTKTGK